MAVDKKISELASGAPAQAGDEYVVARSGANYKLTLTNIAASMPPIGATTPDTGAFTTLSATTGNITTVNATTVDATNVEVTNVKAKDGTAAIVIADSTGNVGIGTASPSSKLSVGGNPPTSGIVAGVSAADGISLALSDNTNNSLYVKHVSGGAATLGTDSGGQLAFATNGFSERMRIDASGNVGIGGTADAYAKVDIRGTLPTSSNVSDGYRLYATIPSGSTNGASCFVSFPSTQAASFTVSDLYHFRAIQDTFGAGSAVTSQYGFHVASSLTGATNNYGFYGNIASGSNRYNVYMAGTADNYFAGNVGIGTASPGQLVEASKSANGDTAIKVTNANTGSLATAQFFASNGTTQTQFFHTGTNYGGAGVLAGGGLGGIYNNTSAGISLVAADSAGTIKFGTGGTSERMRIDSSGNVGIGTASPNFKEEVSQGSGSAAPSLRQAPQLVLKGWGGGGTYHSGIGFSMSEHTAGYWGSGILEVDDSGSYGAALAFYTSTGAASAVPTEKLRISSSGNVGIGSTSLTQFNFRLSNNITGNASSQAIRADGTIQSGVTTEAVYVQTRPSTVAASFTLTDLASFAVTQGTFGASSAVTNQYGFRVDSSLTGATNNYGFYSNIASGTNRWNFYAAGTAHNYFAGTTTFNNGAIFLNNSVGVGTSTPARLFEVRASGTDTPVRFGNANVNMEIGGAGSVNIDSLSWEMLLLTSSTERIRIDLNGNVVINTAAIATTATNGFLYVPTCAGTPTGTPTTYTGRSPIVVDTTNNKLYFYSGGQWRDAGP